MSEPSKSIESTHRIGWRKIPHLVKDTVLEYLQEKGFFHGAALAYYTLFAIVPLFYLSISYLGKIIGQDLMLEIIRYLMHDKVGIEDVSGIMNFMERVDFESGNFAMEVIGILVLLVASSAFLVSLKQSINDFYSLKINFSTKKKQIFNTILFRMVSVLLVGAITLLIIIFYIAQTVLISISDNWFEDMNVLHWFFAGITRHGLAIISNTLIFLLVFKYVNDGAVRWKNAFAGALLTSILLYVGQLLIKYYLFNVFYLASAGILGTLFIILSWVYYSSQIIFFGAKFTAVYSRYKGSPIHFKE